MQPGLPILKRTGIDTHPPSHLPPGEPLRPAGGDEPFGEGGGRCRGIVAQKSDDPGNVLNQGAGFVAFPVRDGRFADPGVFGNLPLEDAEVDPAGTDVVA